VVYTLVTAVQIVALIKIAQPYFPVPETTIALVATFGIGAYVLYSGYGSVTVTDVIQFLVMGLCYFALAGGVLLIGSAAAPPAGAIPVAPQAMPGEMILLLALPLLFVPVSQDLHIRVNSAASPGHARAGVLLAGVTYLVFGLVSVNIGRSLADAGVPLARADLAVPEFLARHFGTFSIIPTIAIGCVIISSLDSALFAAGSSFAYDLWDRLARPAAGAREGSRPRIATAVVLGAALFIALREPQIIKLVLSAVVIYVSVLLPMLLGTFLKKRSSALGALAILALVVIASLEALAATLPFRVLFYTIIHVLAAMCLPKEPAPKTTP
jgi:SSS family solute:Na+ symporter